MKTLIVFFITCLIGSGAFLAGTNMDNPLPAFVVGFGVWILFLWYLTKKRV